jgi:choline-sulfatase
MSKPNILIIMVDQLNGTFFPDGPADWLHAPNLKALAARSTRFANAYTASPLCAPGRASFMSGQLPSRTGVYDNAAEFASSIPTCVGRATKPVCQEKRTSLAPIRCTASKNA